MQIKIIKSHDVPADITDVVDGLVLAEVDEQAAFFNALAAQLFGCPGGVNIITDIATHADLTDDARRLFDALAAAARVPADPPIRPDWPSDEFKVVGFVIVGDRQVCRQCGCTDTNACHDNGRACHWVADDLCSACA